jgi:hypothetical protein
LINKNYRWSGLEVFGTHLDVDVNKEQVEFRQSKLYDNSVSFGKFGDSNGILYEDHFNKVPSKYEEVFDDESIITDVLDEFSSINLMEYPEKEDGVTFEVQDVSLEEIKESSGDLYLKTVDEYDSKPFKVSKEFLGGSDKIKDFIVFGENLIIETDSVIKFIPYSFDGEEVKTNLGYGEMLMIPKGDCLGTKILFNEQKTLFYILLLEEWKPAGERIFVIPRIVSFDPKNYKLEDVIRIQELVYDTAKIKNHCKSWYSYEE